MTSPTKTSEDVSDEDFEIIDKSSESCESLGSVSAETYLSLPEEILARSSVKELEDAIENCKSVILTKPENSADRKWLVRRIIELRLRLEDIKGSNEGGVSEDVKKESSRVMLGHHFTLQNQSTSISEHYCDRCSSVIWDVLHSWYLCSDCNYSCHVQCLSYVCRICAHVVVSENPEFILEICPEAEEGLANQNYRCAECLVPTHFTKNKIFEGRLCDYTGKYYCRTCHWNSASVIPARIIFNWDFRERPVSRSSKQILKLMSKLPILKLEKLNPVLFACVEELGTVKELRRQLMQTKKYLISCRAAGKTMFKMLWQSGDKVHFLENEDSYSLQDLLDLRSGDLIPWLNKMRDSFVRHITVDCEVCRGRGFFCELCTDKNIIFPFQEDVASCSKCHSAFHFSCWISNSQNCPKCCRIRQRLLKTREDPISTAVDS